MGFRSGVGCGRFAQLGVLSVAGILGANAEAAPVFTDVTVQAGVDYVQGVTVFGPLSMSGGAAIGDYDGDGWDDLYVTRSNDTDILFRNRGDGTFEDVTVAAGLTLDLPSNGAAWGDVDNDGDLDLYVTCVGTLRYYLFINDGQGQFTEEAVLRGAEIATTEDHHGWSIVFGDYDRDGWLDIYVTEWLGKDNEFGHLISHQRLLRNLGAAAPAGSGQPGYFEDVTVAAGLDIALDRTNGFSPAFVDFDDDGWLDLAIASDYFESRLFLNNQDGTFDDVTDTSGCCLDGSGMGSAIGDFDGDGDLDWYVTEINKNKMYENLGAGLFSEVSNSVGVLPDATWGWGAVFLDYDNDGDLDLTHANGYRDGPTNVFLVDQIRFWENDGLGNMTEKSTLVGLTDTGLGTAMHTFDYDHDGDLDLFVVNNAGHPKLYRNDGGNAQRWLRVRLYNPSGNTEGLGAKITLLQEVAGPVQFREMGVSSHYLGQSERVAHFGLGAISLQDTIASLTIEWPDGEVYEFLDVPVNQVLKVVLGDADNDGLSDEDEVNMYFTDPFDSDSDDDGIGDGEELAWGTDPNNAGSTPPAATWVDLGPGSAGSGAFVDPYENLMTAVMNTTAGGLICILQGASSQVATINKDLRIVAIGGTVTVGNP